MNFVDKYSPRAVGELIGLDENVSKINEFLEKFDKVKKKALLLVGPEGSGKTSSVYAIAETKGYEVIEVNASDKRNAENVKNIVGNASKQATLFAKPKIILIDEVDGLHGNLDRGGVKEINSIIKETRFPIIMTANDEYSKRISSLKTSATVIKYKRRSYWDVYKLIKMVCESEGKELTTASFKKLASMAQGDVRSAFNDLQNINSDSDVDNLYERIKETNIFDVLKAVFKSRSVDSLKDSLSDFSDLEYAELAIGENIINEYEKPHEVREAYDWFSKAMVFNARAYRRMDWRMSYVYARLFCSLGIGLSKDEMYKKWSKYDVPPYEIKKLGATRKARDELKLLAEEISRECHCSKKKALREYSRFYKIWQSREA
ncbi:MAG: replication factor C large subunit [Nanoarchaeota archaeon]|nr:replication factor C large subunit [Nanoarchaeota archaeon]